MNEVIIAALAAGVGSIITIIGKVIVDIIRAKKEPDESDLELKNELEREKEKSNSAIKDLRETVLELRQSIDKVNESVD